MIGKKGNINAIPPAGFAQMQTKFLFLPDLLKKKIIGYAAVNIIWLIYEENEQLIKVPVAKSRKYWEAMIEEPEFAAFGRLKQIYIL